MSRPRPPRAPAGRLRWVVLVVGGGLALQLGGCGRTSPSALDPHGPGADRVAGLWRLLFWISAVVFVVVCLLVAVALARRRGDHDTLVRRGGGELRRRRDDDDRRLVRVRLTPAGSRRVAGLGTAHLEELRRLASLAGTIAAVNWPRTAARGRPGP